MVIKISKKDAKVMVEQSRHMVQQGELQIELAKKAIRKSTLDITSAKAIIKYLGGK